MQVIVMVTSIVLSAFVSFWIARKQLNHQRIAEEKDALKRHEEMLAKWIVLSSDMIKALQADDHHRDDAYQDAERALEKQFALIGLEYHAKQYDIFISQLNTFIRQAREIYQYDIHAISMEQFQADQHTLNESIRQLVAEEAKNIK